MGRFGAVRNLLAPVARRSYPLSRAMYGHRFRHRCSKSANNPLLVLTMGKVGTKTLVASLANADLNRCLFETHHLSSRFLGKLESNAVERFRSDTKPAEYVWKCQCLREQFLDAAQTEPWKVVTIVREPVSRNMSDFFQNINAVALAPGRYRVFSEWHGFDIEIRQESIDALIQIFFDKYNHRIHESWFDRNFRDVIGIDLYETPFDQETGYSIVGCEKAEVLVLTLEHLHDHEVCAFQEFLGLEDFHIQVSNTTEEKAVSEVYAWFKSSIRFPESYLDEMYASRYAQHFYSQADIRMFRERLSGPVSTGMRLLAYR